MIACKPVVPVPPFEAAYPVEKLNLFPRLTRATYLDLYGVEPPAWDTTRKIKRWFDTSVLEGFSGDIDNEVVAYDVFEPSSATGTRRLVLTLREASTPNLPGAVSYPKYVIAPTPAVVITPITGERTPVNPSYLSLREEAEALARELGVESAAVRESALTGFTTAWNGEQRRPWVVEFRGTPHQVSLLLQRKYAHGVGAPGRWDLSGEQPVWAPEQQDTGERDLRPEVPIPMRRLLEFEQLDKPSPFSGWMVQRKDLTPPSPDELLQRIDRRVIAIAQFLGV